MPENLAQPSPMDERKKTWLLLGLIALVAIVAYVPALQAGFIWDDNDYVEENMTLRTGRGLWRMWTEPYSIPQYYPLVHTTFWLEYQLFGGGPFSFHLVNLLLHLGASFLLFVVVRRLALPGAVLIAGVFALHPVMVESVAWVTERKNVLSMVFYLSSLSMFLRFSGLHGTEDRQSRHWVWMFVFFLLALTSKSVTFSLPFTCLLILWWKRGRIAWADIVPLLPLIAAGAAYGYATGYIEADKVGASGPEWDNSFTQRCLIAGRVPWFYLYKLFWPARLTFIYPHWDVDPSVGWQWAFPIATLALIGVLVFVAWRKGVRGPLAAILMFGGTLFPALGFINVYPFRYSYVADHFQYHASLGVIVLVGAFLARRVPARVGLPIAAIVLGLFAARVFVQCQKYESREVLYHSILADQPDNWFAQNNLAAIHTTQGKFDAAFKGFVGAHTKRPIIAPKATAEAYAHAQMAPNIGRTWSIATLAPLLQRAGQLRAQAQQMQAMGQDPRVLTPQMKAVDGEIQAGWAKLQPYYDRMERGLRRSIQLSPEYASPHVNLGVLLNATAEFHPQPLERMEEATRMWTKYLTLVDRDRLSTRPRLHRLHLRLAEIYAAQGKQGAAAAHRQAAHQVRQSDPNLR